MWKYTIRKTLMALSIFVTLWKQSNNIIHIRNLWALCCLMQRYMIALVYLGSMCSEFHAAGWICWFWCPFIWSHVSGLMWFLTADQKQQHVNICKELHQITSNHAAFFPGLSLVTLRQSNTLPNGKVQNHGDRKRQDRWRAKSRAWSSFTLTSVWLLTKNSSWHAKRPVPLTAVMFYSDCVKMCKDFTPNFDDKRTGCCIMTTHHLTLPFSPRNFLPETI
jgi:hypothetical protein